jgi:hypothetical protein
MEGLILTFYIMYQLMKILESNVILSLKLHLTYETCVFTCSYINLNKLIVEFQAVWK